MKPGRSRRERLLNKVYYILYYGFDTIVFIDHKQTLDYVDIRVSV